MKLLHYSRKQERPGYAIEEYVVLTEADEQGETRSFGEVTEAFRRCEFELSGIHDVTPDDTALHALPLETELHA